MNAPTLEPQIGFRFRLVHVDGRQEVMIVDAERALIGSATHCELRLPPEMAAHEHVELFAHEGTVHFATKPLARAYLPVLDGVPTIEGRWSPGSALRIGGVQIFVDIVSLAMPRAKPPIWALFAAAVAVALTTAGIALAQPAKKKLTPVPEAPALFGPKDARCPEVSMEQRLVLATEKQRIALAKRERSPFAPQEAFEAVSMFELAAACYRTAGEPESAKEADEAADALRAKVDEEYRLRRLRLEHAYRTHQVNAAKRELAVLVAMTAHTKGPYTEFLAALDRAATQELKDKKKLY